MKLIKEYNDITAIIFDLGGVVLNLDMELTFNAFAQMGIDSKQLLYMSGGPDGIIGEYEKGLISSEEFLRRIISLIPGNVAQDDIVSAWNKMLLNLPPSRIELLQSIKQNYPIYLLSNTNEIHVEAFEKGVEKEFGYPVLNEIFTETYYSCRMGMRKPDVEIYRFVTDKHDLDPKRTLFIDDNSENVTGAIKAGLQGLHLKPGNTIEQLFRRDS